jgi:arabinogalactan oligomer/maltooligosaccharide transport system substrate-binding protein
MRTAPLIIGALSLVATACSGGSSAPTTTTTTAPPVVTTTSNTPPSTVVVPGRTATQTIEIWAPAALLGSLADAAAAFETDTGITVDVTAVEEEAMLALLLEDPAGGPDVYVGPHSWLITLTGSGLAEPLTADPSVVAGAADGVRLRGIEYAAPIGLDTLAQFRDPTALAASPSTVEAFAAGCVVDGTTLPCLALSASSVEGHWPFFTAPGGYLFGPEEFEGWDKDDVGLDTDASLAGGLVLASIVGGTGILGDDDTSTARDRFVNGEAPLFWGTTGDLAALEVAGAEFVVEALPTIGGAPAAGPVSTTALWVNGFSADKEAAVILVEEYLALPESARTLAIALGLAPVDTDFADDDADLAPFTLGARTGLPVPPISAADLAWAELADAVASIRLGGSSETALRGAASNIRAGA